MPAHNRPTRQLPQGRLLARRSQLDLPERVDGLSLDDEKRPILGSPS